MTLSGFFVFYIWGDYVENEDPSQFYWQLKILLFLTHLRSWYPFLAIYKWFWGGSSFFGSYVFGLRFLPTRKNAPETVLRITKIHILRKKWPTSQTIAQKRLKDDFIREIWWPVRESGRSAPYPGELACMLKRAWLQDSFINCGGCQKIEFLQITWNLFYVKRVPDAVDWCHLFLVFLQNCLRKGIKR